VPRSSQDRKLKKWLSEGASVGIGAIGWAEFLCGPVEPSQAALAARFLGEPVSFTAEDAELSARLFNLSGRRRGSLADCMVAATALRLDATLATANVIDFARFEPAGLKVSRPQLLTIPTSSGWSTSCPGGEKFGEKSSPLIPRSPSSTYPS
jgi:predicted nucleic acid-binding protein